MAPLLSMLSRDGARWTRPGTGAERVAVDAETRAWLDQVQAETASRWQTLGARGAGRDAPARAGSSAGTAALRLDRDGLFAASVEIEDGGVRFESPAGAAWFAPLPPDVVARLRASLPRPSR